MSGANLGKLWELLHDVHKTNVSHRIHIVSQLVFKVNQRRTVPKEKKDADLHLRIRPSVKKLAEQMAEDDDRSLSSMVERVIVEAAKKRGLKYDK